MKRIEPGMLCLVVSGHNAGRECTTIRRVVDGQMLPELGPGAKSLANAWLIHGPSIRSLSLYDGEVYRGGYGLAIEQRLMPLSGGDKLEDLETAEDWETAT